MKKMEYVIILSMVLALSACGNNKKDSDAAMDIALKNIQLDELREKNAELEAKVEELEKENQSDKETTQDYDIEKYNFEYKYDDNNVFTMELRHNKTLDMWSAIVRSNYAEGFDTIMKYEFVMIADKLAKLKDSIIDYQANVGEKNYSHLYYDGATQFNTIPLESIEELSTDDAIKFAEMYTELEAFFESCGLK